MKKGSKENLKELVLVRLKGKEMQTSTSQTGIHAEGREERKTSWDTDRQDSTDVRIKAPGGNL